MRVIRPAEYRSMPWKNGGGVTVEIYTNPPSAAFDWRVSIATVNAAGPFSTFAGYERHIMTLSGEGMVLDIGGRGKVALEPLQPFSFSGDVKVHGALLQGPVMDFNLIVRRDFGQGTLRVIEGNAGDTLGSENSFHLVYVLEGECRANDLKANDSVYLGRADFLALPTPMKLAVCEVTPRRLPVPGA